MIYHMYGSSDAEKLNKATNIHFGTSAGEGAPLGGPRYLNSSVFYDSGLGRTKYSYLLIRAKSQIERCLLSYGPGGRVKSLQPRQLAN